MLCASWEIIIKMNLGAGDALGLKQKWKCAWPKADVNTNLICKLGNGVGALGRFL
jgi:hypothetical protein